MKAFLSKLEGNSVQVNQVKLKQRQLIQSEGQTENEKNESSAAQISKCQQLMNCEDGIEPPRELIKRLAESESWSISVNQ